MALTLGRCVECRKRYIKCQREIPECTRCVQRGTVCSYVKKPWVPGKAVPLAITLGKSSDRRLMHHFTTETWLFFSDQPGSRQLWQEVVPNEALNHPFLLSALYAVAALHLATSVSSDSESLSYKRLAARHQTVMIQRLVQEGTINRSNYKAMLAMSILIKVLVFASPRTLSSMAFTQNSYEPTGWPAITANIQAALVSHGDLFKNGELGELLVTESSPLSIYDEASDSAKHFDELLQLCKDRSNDINILEPAVIGLKTMWIKLFMKTNTECDVLIMFEYPATLPTAFFTMLDATDPLALVILAHYCALVYFTGNYWWKIDWAEDTIKSIVCTIDKAWYKYLKWPMETMYMTYSSREYRDLDSPLE